MILLDTSALIALHQREPGTETVAAALESGQAWVAAPSWFEIRVAIARWEDPEPVARLFKEVVAGTVPVTEAVAAGAYELQRKMHSRLPAVDALISACAISRGYRLLHRDRHMAAIPQTLLQHETLPLKPD